MRRSLIAAGGLLAFAAAFRGQTPAPATADQAMLKQYCLSCHSERLKTGNLVLENLDPSNPAGHIETWEKVVRKVRAGMMPPSGSPRPARTQLDEFAGRLETALDREAGAHPNPGSVALHRLNRTEYANAVRDLLASISMPARFCRPTIRAKASTISRTPWDLAGFTRSYVAAATNVSRHGRRRPWTNAVPPPIACRATLAVRPY